MPCRQLNCTRSVLEGFSKCQYHLDKNVAYMRNKRAKDRLYYERELQKNDERRDRYQAEGRCRRCSKKLDNDADYGKKECLNCRERTIQYVEI